MERKRALIIALSDFARWLGEEPDPADLMRPFPAEPMRMWPISTRSTSRRTTIRPSSSLLIDAAQLPL